MNLTWGKLMRMYKVYHQDRGMNYTVDWFPREDEAKQFYEKLQATVLHHPHGIEVVDIPINRLGLCAWLNVNVCD